MKSEVIVRFAAAVKKKKFGLSAKLRSKQLDAWIRWNPPTRFGVHSLLFLCSIQNFVTRCPSKIPSPKSKIQDPQNPKSPKSKIQTLHIKICYIMFQKSKIQNPQNPENPKSPKSKIQNPQNPKSPKSKIQNPKIPQNPKSKIDFGFLDFGDFGDFGFWGFWWFWIFGFWGGPGDVPLGNLVTVPGGQRLESPLVCLWGPLQNQLYRIELGQGSKLNIFSEVRTVQNHRKTLTSNPEVRTLQNHRRT